ncbi:hypothetical protein [uncultured Roseobacter sp.]|uniref:hypothetical protein n=1 Tax=uncultured Roseobacter sp. TaxID=114847 RepID=UPI00261C2131|nr:hypothetical protein [uncultured Roseobacter sp.]
MEKWLNPILPKPTTAVFTLVKSLPCTSLSVHIAQCRTTCGILRFISFIRRNHATAIRPEWAVHRNIHVVFFPIRSVFRRILVSKGLKQN